MIRIEIFTDGSATIAENPGGYGWVLIVDGIKHSEGNGHVEKGTNNDLELEAAIHGLTAVYKFVIEQKKQGNNGPFEVLLRSDSQLVLFWADGSHRFKQLDKLPRYNILRELFKRLNATSKWVQGHSGHEHNERADLLANLGRLKLGINDSLPKTARKNKKKREKIKEKLDSMKNSPVPATPIGRKTENVFNIWFKGVLKIVDLEKDLCENYDETIHGKRNSVMEYKIK